MRTIRGILLLAGIVLVATGCLDVSQPLHVTPQLNNGTASPGLWRSVGGDDCWGWGQYTTYKGNWQMGQVISFRPWSFGPVGGPVYAQIIDHDGRFEASGCAPFWLVGGPWDRPLATPGQPFGPGDYRVGYEIAPGTYVAPGIAEGNTDCRWERVNDFAFSTDSIIEGYWSSTVENPGPQTLTIDEHDFGFSSSGCGTWTKTE